MDVTAFEISEKEEHFLCSPEFNGILLTKLLLYVLGEGSLISYLRKKVWALSLTAGNHGDGVEFNTTCSLFAITIVLTKAGHEHIREVNVPLSIDA